LQEVAAVASPPFEVLLIEDDQVLGGAVVQRLKLEGFAVRWCETCRQALAELGRRRPDFVLADIRLPDGSGEEIYRQTMPHLGDTPIVFATAFADIEQAVRLVRAGADDYLTKPYDVDALVERLRSVAATKDCAGPATAEQPALQPFGLSPATAGVAGDLQRVATTDLPVLLLGETGVGKEVAARMLHARSPRAGSPFVAVNCGAIVQELMESQFFGHERGAFTGARSAHAGFFEEAGEGTLFLDEIGELDARLQTALLRVLNDGTFRRVGGRQDLRFSGRIIAATNADLGALVASKAFREDLYYRLAVVEIRLPPLRDRPEEITVLARRFVQEAAGRIGRPGLALDESAAAALLVHGWPGNVRELRNRIERAAALADSATLAEADLFPERRLDQAQAPSLAGARERADLDQIERAMILAGGRVSDAARHLGISRTTLWKLRKKQGGADQS
jgi:DNA-binding NtrC family response regulator